MDAATKPMADSVWNNIAVDPREAPHNHHTPPPPKLHITVGGEVAKITAGNREPTLPPTHGTRRVRIFLPLPLSFYHPSFGTPSPFRSATPPKSAESLTMASQIKRHLTREVAGAKRAFQAENGPVLTTEVILHMSPRLSARIRGGEMPTSDKGG